MADGGRREAKIEAIRSLILELVDGEEVRHHSEPDRGAEVFTVLPWESRYRIWIPEEFISDHSETELVSLLREWNLGEVLIASGGHDVLVTEHGLELANG